MEASEIFLRLLRGDTISSDDIRSTVLSRENFRSDEDWNAVQNAAGGQPDEIEIGRDISLRNLNRAENWPRTNWNWCRNPWPKSTRVR